MAEKDLGSIPYTNVNQGTRVVDRSAEARAIGQGLSVAKTTIDEAVKASVTGDMLQAIEDTESVVPEIPAMEFDPNSQEAQLITKMDRLTAVIEQGKVSQQTAAQMKIDNILANAQINYPWLYDELQRRAGAVQAGSARMTQLGIDDSLRAAAAKQAQKQFDEIYGHATASWKSGGLGIDPSIDPRSSYWARLYSYRQGLRNIEETAAVELGNALARANLAVYGQDPDVYLALEKNLQGEFSTVGATLEGIRLTHEYDKYFEERNKGINGDLAYIEKWKGLYADEMKQDILRAKLSLENSFYNEISKIPDLLETSRGKQLKTRFDSVITAFDAMMSNIEQLKDDIPNAEQALARGMALLATDAFTRVPAAGQEEIAFFTSGPGAKMLELSALIKNPSGITLPNQVAISQQSYLAQAFPALNPNNPNFPIIQQLAFYNSTGALNIPPGAGAAEIQSAIRAAQVDPNATFVLPTRNTEEQKILALHEEELHMQLLRIGRTVIKDADHEYANNALLGLTHSISFLNTSPNPPNVQDQVLNSLADGALLNAINISLATGVDGRRQAFGAEASEFYYSTNPLKVREEAGLHYQEGRVGNKALSELVKIDVTALGKGDFKWVIDDEVLAEAARFRLIDRLGGNRQPGEKEIEASIRRTEQVINEEMQMILNKINHQIAIERAIAKAQAPSIAALRMEDDWTAHFLGTGGAEQDQRRAWANYFNYTETGSLSKDR